MRYKLLAATLFSAASLLATEPLDNIVEGILDNNTELKAIQARQKSDISAQRSENMLQGPEAQFSFVASPEEKKWDISVSQGFEWPGVYSARSKAADLRMDAFDLLYRQERRDVELQVREAILNYVKIKSKRMMLENINSNLSKLTAAYDKALSHGEATVLDVRKLEILSFNIARDIAATENELQEYKMQLRAMNGDQDVAVDINQLPIPELHSEAAYFDRISQSDPAVRASEAMKAATRADLNAANRAALPGFSVGYVHEYEENTHFNGFSVGINLPSWSNRHKKNKIKEELMAIDFEQSAYINQRKAQIADDYATASRVAKLLEKGKFLLNDEYATLLEKSLNAGQIDLITYLTDINEFLDARTSYLDLQLEYALATSRLNILIDK